MTTVELIAKIRAEIERLKTNAINHGKCYCEYEKGYIQSKKDSYEHFLSFLSDLEKSLPKATDCEGLEEEIERYLPDTSLNVGAEHLKK